MQTLRMLIARVALNEQGQDLIEYALLAAFIALATAGATGLVGTELNGWYTDVSGSINTWPTIW